jgi:glutamate/aspartate transport system permease protein
VSLDWSIFCRSTTGGTGAEPLAGCLGQNGELSYLQWLLSAWGWTATVALLGFVIALLIGLVIGTLRTLPSTSGLNRWSSRFAAAWVELFRDIPLLVQVFLWYYVAPFFLPALKSLPSWLLVSIALGLFTSARIAEQVRAGIQSLPRGQRDAALALGMRESQVYQRVILPVALRIMLPALTSEAMSIVKNSSVAFAVAVAELTQFAMQAQEETARGIEIYLAVTLLYALTAFAVNRLLALIEARVRVPGVGTLARQGA